MIRWPFSAQRSRSEADALIDEQHRPYAETAANQLYNQLFCDDPRLYLTGTAMFLGPWRLLTAPQPRPSALNAILTSDASDPRAQALAAHLLRSARQTPDIRQTYGVILEVPMREGLDTLAAYADGAVRYIDAYGAAVVFDRGAQHTQSLARTMVRHADHLAGRLTPWTRPRLPPPRVGDVRISVLAADGLRFTEGSFAALQQNEDLSGLIGKAARLLRTQLPESQSMLASAA